MLHTFALFVATWWTALGVVGLLARWHGYEPSPATKERIRQYAMDTKTTALATRSIVCVLVNGSLAYVVGIAWGWW